MIDYLEELLLALRPAFSRQATFSWFIIAVAGFVMRTDTYGVSSIIRALCLVPLCYPCLLHFFHSAAWNTPNFLRHWWLWMIRQGVAYMVNNRRVFTGDHTKNVKDGRKIPEVETLHQDSETGSKPSKNLLGGLCYHFWSKYLQKSSRRPTKKDAPKPVSKNPQKTKKTLEAIQKFVVVQIVVLGVLQLMALKFPKEIINRAQCWMRTPPAGIPSEFITKIALVNIINNNLTVFAKNMITRIILEKRCNDSKLKYFNKAA